MSLLNISRIKYENYRVKYRRFVENKLVLLYLHKIHEKEYLFCEEQMNER